MSESADPNNPMEVKSDGGSSESENQSAQQFVCKTLQDSTRWIIWYMRRLMQAWDIYSKELARSHSVSEPQLSCLLALREYGPLNLSKLAKYIIVKPSTVTGIIDRLEQKGLARRERTGKDRRVITIALTEAGNSLVDQAPPPIPKAIVESLNNLSEKETQDIVKSLSTLVSMLEEETI
jgi:DNA-binding MarR family transcriptional regulator